MIDYLCQIPMQIFGRACLKMKLQLPSCMSSICALTFVISTALLEILATLVAMSVSWLAILSPLVAISACILEMVLMMSSYFWKSIIIFLNYDCISLFLHSEIIQRVDHLRNMSDFKFAYHISCTCDTDNGEEVSLCTVKAFVIPISITAITPMPIGLIITRTSENTKFWWIACCCSLTMCDIIGSS